MTSLKKLKNIFIITAACTGGVTGLGRLLGELDKSVCQNMWESTGAPIKVHTTAYYTDMGFTQDAADQKVAAEKNENAERTLWRANHPEEAASWEKYEFSNTSKTLAYTGLGLAGVCALGAAGTAAAAGIKRRREKRPKITFQR